MTTFPFPVRKTYCFAAKCLVLLGVASVNLVGSPVQASYHCPVGQIYRVSKNECVPKAANLALLKQKKLTHASSASVHHAKDAAPAEAQSPAVAQPVADTVQAPAETPAADMPAAAPAAEAPAAPTQAAPSAQVNSSPSTSPSPYGVLSYR